MDAAGEPVGDPPWDAWTPTDVARHLGSLAVPWCVTAGWAIDLFLGRQTREHEDLEIAVPSAAWPSVREQLSSLEFVVPCDQRLWPLDSPTFDETVQTWGRDTTGSFRIDVFREPHEAERWVCRRDERITMPYAELITTNPSGVPMMVPEVVLLFKAKHDRDKDRHDLGECLPLLSTARRTWLREALLMVHPGHAWLELLA